MSKSGNTILALITGAAIGSALGLLYAPEKGDKTRKKLSKGAKDAQNKLNRQIKETTDSLSASAQKAKRNFDQKLDETLTSASEKADDIIVAMEKKLEDLRRKNAKATDEVIEEVKDTNIPSTKKA